MKMIGRYQMTTQMGNQNAGNSFWCFASREGQNYFIKQFISPRHPDADTHSSPEQKAKKAKKCLEFEQRKTKFYQAINARSDGNAVRIVDVFRIGAKYYMAMPKIDSLKMTVEDISELPNQVNRRLCAVIAHTISCLHAGKIVHSDIKHTNIMIANTRANHLTAKVTDYDSGFFEYEPPVNPEDIGGDVVYLSPEVWKSKMVEMQPLTCKLDVFSMGILFHQYLTGVLPGYDKSRFCCVGEAVVSGEVPNLSKDLPEDLQETVRKMLLADPAQRPDAYEVYHVFIQPFKKGGNGVQEDNPRPTLDPLGQPGFRPAGDLI